MEIYGEFFFLENFIANLLILLLTAKLWGRRPAKGPLLLGTFGATIYAFGIFTPAAPFFYHPIIKVLFACIITRTVFRDVKGDVFAKLVVTFFCAGFLLGGAVTALLYLTGTGGTVYGGGFYMEKNSYGGILCCIAAGYCFLRFFLNIFKERKAREETLVELTVKVGEKTKTLRGLVDTGNFLIEPIERLPVMIGEAEVVRELLPMDWEKGKIRIIPYSSIGKERGALLGVKADEITLLWKGEQIKNVEGVLAAYQGKLSEDGEYQVIVHPQMLRRQGLALEK